jgi:GTP-binding protein HflX
VAAFQSTLQEARSAQLLIHVIDASDPRHDEYTEQVNAVLAEIGAGTLPQLQVYNKIDRLGVEPRVERDAAGEVAQAWVSAVQGRGLGLLCAAIAERLQLHAQRGWLRLPVTAGALRAQLLARGAVREEQAEEDGTLRLLVELPAPQLEALARDPQVTLELLPAGPPCAGSLPYLESTGPVPPGVRYAGRSR